MATVLANYSDARPSINHHIGFEAFATDAGFFKLVVGDAESTYAVQVTHNANAATISFIYSGNTISTGSSPFPLNTWNEVLVKLQDNATGTDLKVDIAGTTVLTVDVSNEATYDFSYDAGFFRIEGTSSGHQVRDVFLAPIMSFTSDVYMSRGLFAEKYFNVDYTDLKNKPTVPPAQIQSDWTQTDNTKVDFIKNKPPLAAAQLQTDWNISDNTSLAYIKNKPSIVNTFNTRNGNVTLIQSDVINALGYTPVASSGTGSYTELYLDPNDLTVDIAVGSVVLDYLGTSFINDPTFVKCGTTVSRNNYKQIANELGIPSSQSTFTLPSPKLRYEWIENAPSSLNLATVATTGSYNDLVNKPSLATVATTGSYNDLVNKPSIPPTYPYTWNDIGSYVMACRRTKTITLPGTVVSGLELYVANTYQAGGNYVGYNNFTSSTLPGNWRCQGCTGYWYNPYGDTVSTNTNLEYMTTLWVRVS